ncbi:MAG: Hsp20/alpha crystallin family protein [Candidatus Izemoplasmatales bacterium]
MNSLIKVKNFIDLLPSIFDDDLSGNSIFGINHYPKANTYENDDGYGIEFYYPGAKKDDFKINVDKQIITISSDFSDEKKQEGEKYYFKEFRKAQFKRSFSLPDEVIKNKIKASYENGVLKIDIPKDKVKEKEKRFDIKIE